MIVAIFENILIMVLTIVSLLGGGYVALILLEWGLKKKSGQREQKRLTDLWITAQSQSTETTTPKQLNQATKE